MQTYNEESRVASIMAQVRQADLHDHNMLIYSDLPTITNYDPFDKVIAALKQVGISVNNETKEGNLAILDSLKTYQIDVNGSVNFTKSLVTRAARDGKAGIINLADLGSFFLSERVPLLVEYEQSLQRKMAVPAKGICAYHKDDFASLSKEQQEEIIAAHNCVMLPLD
jgi:short-subunit dehydrogenase